MIARADGLMFHARWTMVRDRWLREADRGSCVQYNKEKVASVEFIGNELLETNGSLVDRRVSELEYANRNVNEHWGQTQLNALHQIGLQLQGLRSPGSLAREVLQILSTTLDYKRCAILLDTYLLAISPNLLRSHNFRN